MGEFSAVYFGSRSSLSTSFGTLYHHSFGTLALSLISI